MNDNQEPAMAALLAYCENKLAATFPVIQENTDFFSNVSENPALFLWQPGADDTWSGTVLSRSEMDVQAWIVVKSGSDETPGQLLRRLAYAFRSIFALDGQGNPLRLKSQNGLLLAYHVRIEGRTDYYPSTPGKTACAIIPLKFLLP